MRSIVLGLALLLASCSRYPEECELMIREVAEWGVLEIGGPDEVSGSTYTWNRGSVVLTNGYGARIDASATCEAVGSSMFLELESRQGSISCFISDEGPSCVPTTGHGEY